ncbi:MAG TPA: hypothetical protein VGQ72_10410 [Pyrinomonadaceae bacterium]|jgi:uncharacterized protein YceK|nr:hypothetical protein [Pyrinomonadaceae bacterium]
MRVTMLLVAIVLLSGCSNRTEVRTSQNSSPSNQAGEAKVEKAMDTGAANSSAPVEFTNLGMSSDRVNVSYKIKVNTDKPIDEVHLGLKETDGKGKVVDDTTIIWQNMVGSTRKPIERGKTYEDQTALDPGTEKAEMSLKEVIFKDGSKWSAR